MHRSFVNKHSHFFTLWRATVISKQNGQTIIFKYLASTFLLPCYWDWIMIRGAAQENERCHFFRTHTRAREWTQFSVQSVCVCVFCVSIMTVSAFDDHDCYAAVCTPRIITVERRIAAAAATSSSPLRRLRVRPVRTSHAPPSTETLTISTDWHAAPRSVKGRRRIHGGMFAKGNSCGRSETDMQPQPRRPRWGKTLA